MIFGALNLRKFDINSLYTCPPHLCIVATLPWEIKKVIFQQYYSYILQIICVISEENKLLLPYPPHLKNINALPCQLHKFFIFSYFSWVSSTNPRYGRVAEASWCDIGWISAEHGGRCSWSVARKTGSMYPCSCVCLIAVVKLFRIHCTLCTSRSLFVAEVTGNKDLQHAHQKIATENCPAVGQGN